MKNYIIGDWATGNTADGELIHGFIEAIDAEIGTITMFVVASDNSAAIGKELKVPDHLMKKLQDSSLSSQDEIEALIDISLLIKDEAWFNELSLKLHDLKTSGKRYRKQSITTVHSWNRLSSKFLN